MKKLISIAKRRDILGEASLYPSRTVTTRTGIDPATVTMFGRVRSVGTPGKRIWVFETESLAHRFRAIYSEFVR